MAKEPKYFEHVFRYKRWKVWLVCFIEVGKHGRQLVLEDVFAKTLAMANGVPDDRIEAEACDAARARRARYM